MKIKPKAQVQVTCRDCGTKFELQVHPEDIQSWQEGVLIQRAMPYLTAEERELLISGTCEKCWNQMFEGDSDAE